MTDARTAHHYETLARDAGWEGDALHVERRALPAGIHLDRITGEAMDEWGNGLDYYPAEGETSPPAITGLDLWLEHKGIEA